VRRPHLASLDPARGFALVFACALALAGCRGDVPELAREDQFAIGLGRLENQIDLFQIQGRQLLGETSLYMRNGTFYVANGGGGKVMEFSSYGDLLLSLYDPGVNPDPVGLSLVDGSGEVASTRRAVRHELPEIGGIAVDNAETIYLVARTSATLAVTDEALGVRRERIVLRFDREGRPLPYLGAGGVGGAPFPPIETIQLTARDELVVVCRTARARLVYWFGADGTPKYESVLSEDQVPRARGAGSSTVISTVIQSICPDQSRPALHLLVDYSRQIVDRATGTVTAILPYSSELHRLNLETGRFDESHELPAVKPRKVRSGGRDVEIPGARYELLGVVKQGAAFLLRPEGEGIYELALLDSQGKLAQKRRLLVDDQELSYMTFHLSSEGILSALLCDATKAHVVWWRCDRIVSPSGR
jgi:hypothetical protein